MNESQGNSYKREFVYTIPESILHHTELTYLDKHIYMLIRSFMDTTGDAYPSNAWIARKCDVDRRTIISSLNRLVKHKAVGKMTDAKGHRHLFIIQKMIPVESVTGSDPNITPPVKPESPPSDPTFTQLDQSLINSKKETTTTCSSSLTPFEKECIELKHPSDDRTPDEYLENVYHHIKYNSDPESGEYQRQRMIIKLLTNLKSSASHFKSKGFVSSAEKEKKLNVDTEKNMERMRNQWLNYYNSPIEIDCRSKGYESKTFEQWIKNSVQS